MSKNTLPVLTKYERAAMLAKRSKQIADGSPITIEYPESNNPYKIALAELEAKTIPITIIRRLPSGELETWYIKDFLTI